MYPVILGEAFDLVTTFRNALQGVQDQFQSMAEVAIPIGLGIFAIMTVVPLGMKLFRKVTG